MTKLFWFPFYYRDFFEDETVRLMSNAQIGIYLKLLAHQWHEGSIPDVDTCAPLLRLPPEDPDLQMVHLKCFQPLNPEAGRFANRRMGMIRAEQHAIEQQKITAGRKGGLAKAENIRQRTSTASFPLLAKASRGLASETKTETKTKTESESESESQTKTLQKKTKICAEVHEPSAPAKSTQTWQAYAGAYEQRYGVPPVRNKSVNALLCRVVEQLGVEEAPQIAAFYLTHNEPFYVRARHPPTLLVRDASGLRTQWATGIKATTGEAKNLEAKDEARAQVERVRHMLKPGGR